MKNFLVLMLASLMINTAYADEISVALPPNSLAISVIENQFIFNKTNIQEANIIRKEDGNYGGLQLEIKPEFADAFIQMTKTGIGKTMNVVYNNRIVTATILETGLTASILLKGLSQGDAQAFVDSLRNG